MKILQKQILPNKSGTVTIMAEEPDDLWVAYNLISPGDVIITQTSRKIHQTTSSGKNKNPSRIKFETEISVTAIDDYAEGSSAVRVSGRTCVGNEHINIGTFHSLELETGKEFALRKQNWNTQALEALENSSGSGCDLGVLLMQEGLANLFLIGKSGSKRCAKILEPGNSKTGGLNKFFESVLCAFTKHIDFDMVRCVVIGSPGRIKDEFRGYMLSKAQKSSKLKSIENNKSAIVMLTTSSGKEGCLNEVLKDAKVMNFVKDTKAAREIRAITEFNDTLRTNSDCVRYGLKSVEAAHELSAIKTLMITEKLFKSPEVALRQEYTRLVESVKEAGGKVMVLSPMHATAEELAKLTGVAAILRFPVPEVDDGLELL